MTFPISLPPELAGGVYANFLAVWHTRHEFTLDFCSTQPMEQEDPDDPGSPVQVPSVVVSRVKIPVSLVFEILKALNDNMTRYEARFGLISQASEREEDA